MFYFFPAGGFRRYRQGHAATPKAGTLGANQNESPPENR